MIELRNINFRYAGGTDAGGLVNIDLIIPDGQVMYSVSRLIPAMEGSFTSCQRKDAIAKVEF